MKRKNYSLTIGWLYPELMSTYGDRGNIICILRRCEWRGIEIEVKHLDVGFNDKQLAICDMLFMGGAQDRQQKIVAEDLKGKASVLKDMIEDEIPGLYICGAYQFLGKYYKILGEQSSTENFASSAYKEADGTVIDGLGILDLYTENPGADKPRLIGNVVVNISDLISNIYDFENKSNRSSIIDNRYNNLVGFENHGGRTYLGKNVKPLGAVIKGFGNNGEDKTEGAIYKNSIGSYLHGPILPKNPHLADFLIQKALEKKYKRQFHLGRLLDSLEWQAHKAILKRLRV